MQIRNRIAEAQDQFQRTPITQRNSFLVFDRTVRRRFDAREQQAHFFLTKDFDKADAVFAFHADRLAVYSGGNALRAENESVNRNAQLRRTLTEKVFRLATNLLQEVIAASAAGRTTTWPLT